MKRLVSLDFLRGLTIALMIIVNTPGSWSHVYAPFLHAEWNGLTPTDLVFPFFLFIVGVSIALAYSSKKQSGSISRKTFIKIFKRSLIIFGLGLFLALFPKFNFENLRIAGVLQRIAIVFCICAILFLKSSWRTQMYIGFGLLIGYYVCMCFIPFGASVAGTLEPGENFAAWIDRFALPGRMYQKTWDPEGLFSTLPAVATGISGLLAGRIILEKGMSNHVKIIWLFTVGLVTLILGFIWNYDFPVNKYIWTSSYVLVTSGLALMLFAASMWVIDEKGYQRWTKIGVVFGMNAITAYVLHGILWRLFQIPIYGGEGIQSIWMTSWINLGIYPKLASLLWAIAYMFFIYMFALILYRKKIFIKV